MPKIKTPNLTEAIVKETKAYMAANPAATPAELDVHLAAFTAKMSENVTDVGETNDVEKTAWYKSPTAITTYKTFGGIAALALAGFGGYRLGRSAERKASSDMLVPAPAQTQAPIEVAPATTITPMKVALKAA